MTSVTVSAGELEDAIALALRSAGASTANAASVARALANAEIDGQKGHGLSRVPSYASQCQVGKVKGRAEPTANLVKPGTLLVDAAHGFAYPAIDLALERLPGMVRKNGIAAAAITRSHHFGVAGHHVERLAEAGFVALVLGNTPRAMAAWGGKAPVLGTNPLAFAAPLRGRAPLVIDLALSGVARGKIMTAAQRGEAIPEGWALDADGNPTTDAKAALGGTLLPLGGAKGAALALMVEVLAAGLTGACLASEASSFLDSAGPPPSVGHVLIAIDAAGFAGAEVFADRALALAAMIEAESGVRLPGSRRLALRQRAVREGVTVDGNLLEQVRALAGKRE